MAALQYVNVPGYSAILFRRTYRDLALPGALMDRAKEWLTGKTGIKWNEQDHTFTFPSGAKLTFGYLETENDKFRYQGAEFQFIGFDELTQFTENQYRYLLSRLRRLEGSHIPLRVRSATNPGGVGHEWVKQRFITEGKQKGRIFIPAKLKDNPSLDTETYTRSLMELDSTTRLQLLNGDWEARVEGSKFKRGWFKIVKDYPRDAKKVRYWDKAATAPTKGKDPDWTAGALVAEKAGQYYIINITRFRGTPQQNEATIKQVAQLDNPTASCNVITYMEQEGGSSGVDDIDHYMRVVLKGYAFYGDKVTGSKEIRANPLASAAEAGNVFLVEDAWINDFLDEASVFPEGSHDDQIDAVSGALNKLAGIRPRSRYEGNVF